MDCQSNWPWKKVPDYKRLIYSHILHVTLKTDNCLLGHRRHSLDIILVRIFKIQCEILLLQPILSKHRQAFQVKGTDKAYLFDTATKL